MQKWSTSDNVFYLLFAQQLLPSLQQQLNMQDESSSQVRGRAEVLTHALQILKCQHFSGKIQTRYYSELNGGSKPLEKISRSVWCCTSFHLFSDMRGFTTLRHSSRETLASSISWSPENRFLWCVLKCRHLNLTLTGVLYKHCRSLQQLNKRDAFF